MTPDSFEGKLVLSMEDALSQLHSMWVEGIKNASKDVNTSVSAETSFYILRQIKKEPING